MSSGEIILPADFDIFIPLPSTTKPCDSILSKGALPLVPQDSKKERSETNLCVGQSLLNTLMLAILNLFFFSKTNECVDPLSNQTSTMSFDFI